MLRSLMRAGQYGERNSQHFLLWLGYRLQAATLGPLPVRLGYSPWQVINAMPPASSAFPCPAYRETVPHNCLRVRASSLGPAV